MTNHEELIEKAAKVIFDWERDVTEWEDLHPGARDDYRKEATKVLAVFEDAQAPTDDEREALSLFDESIFAKMKEYLITAQGSPTYALRLSVHDLLRHPVSPEPSGATAMLAEIREHAERWADRPPSSPYAMGLRDGWRTILNKIDRRSASPQPSADWDRVHNRPADIYTPPEDRVMRPFPEPQGEPTEAMVEAAAMAFTMAPIADKRDGVLAPLRAALRAASEVKP